jgi:hypothetical protein
MGPDPHAKGTGHLDLRARIAAAEARRAELEALYAETVGRLKPLHTKVGSSCVARPGVPGGLSQPAIWAAHHVKNGALRRSATCGTTGSGTGRRKSCRSSPRGAE